MAIATLSIDIEARLASLQDGLDKTMRSVETTMGRLSGSVTAVGAALGALGGTVLAGGLVQFSAALVESIDALNDAADATGSTVERMSALDDFARRTGTTLASVTDVVGALNKALTKAGDDESKGIGQALKAINVDAEALRKLDPADALKTVADALSRFDDDGTKARLVQVIFKDAKTAMPILKDLADQQELVGRVTAAQAAEAEKAGKAWAALKAEGYDFGVSIANSVLPSLNRLISEFKDASAEGLTLWQVLNNVGRTNGPLNDTWTVKAANARKELAALKADSQALTDWEKQAGSQDDYAQRIEKQQRLLAFYERRDKAATDSMANALGLDGIDSKPVINPEAFGAAGKAAKEAKTQVDELAKVLEKIRGLTAKESGLDAGYAADLDTLFAGYKKGRITLDDYRAAVDRLTRAQKFYTDGQAAKAKADEEAAKAQADYFDTWNKYLGSLDEAAVKLEEQAATYGFTSAAIAKLNLVRAEERLEIARTNGVADEYLIKLEQEVEARRRIANAASSVEALEANRKSAEAASAAWQRVADDVGVGLTNAIFEGGKDGWELLRKTVEATVIRATVQPVITGAINNLLQQTGVTPGALGGQPGGGFGMFGGSSGFSVSSFATSGLGQQLGLSSGVATDVGPALQLTQAGSALQSVSNAAPYLYAAYQGLGEGKWGSAAGTAIGMYFGGPIGAAIGSQIGSMLDYTPTYHEGGAYTASTTGGGNAATNATTPGFNLSWGAYTSDRSSQYDTVTKTLSTALANQAAGYMGLFGGALSSLDFTTRFASDGNDWSEGGVRVADQSGKVLFDFVRRYTADASKAIDEFGADTVRAMAGALKASDLEDVFDALFNTLDPLADSVETLNAAFAESAALSQAFALTSESALAEVEGASKSAMSAFLDVGDALRDSATAGTLSAQSILEGLQARYAAEVNVLRDINSMIESIGAGFDSSIRNAQLSVLDAEGKYAFLDAEAARYNDMLATLTDPALIGDYANRLRGSLDAAWALLDDTQRQTSLPDFLERYQAADDLAVSKLADARKQVLDDQTKLISELKVAMTEVYAQQSAAVQQIVSTIPERIALDINVNSNGSVEVGAIEIAGG
jgi:hypothetical protein